MLSRRTFLAGASVAAGLVVETGAPAHARLPRLPRHASTPSLTVRIGDQVVSRDAVLQWEARRLQVVAQRIQHNVPGWLLGDLSALLLRPALSTANVAAERELLVDTKLRLGEAEMRQITSLDLALSNPTAQLTAAPRQWAISRTRITSNVGTGKGFVDWYDARVAANDVRTMLVACPDHYVIETPSSQHQEVIEVTGGAVLASRFLIDYTDNDGLPIPSEPSAAARAAGWARNGNGVPIGAVHHQFVDHRCGGFTADLAVAFPAFLPPFMISEHRWHLACEFSSWIGAYLRTL